MDFWNPRKEVEKTEEKEKEVVWKPNTW